MLKYLVFMDGYVYLYKKNQLLAHQKILNMKIIKLYESLMPCELEVIKK